MAEAWFIISVSSHWPVIQAFEMPPKRRIAEAVACVRKYFVVASTARGCCL